LRLKTRYDEEALAVHLPLGSRNGSCLFYEQPQADQLLPPFVMQIPRDGAAFVFLGTKQFPREPSGGIGLAKALSPKATSLIASGETGPIHMAACGAASRDYVFDGREL